MSQVQLTVSGILADLDEGLDRAAIKEKYGLSNRDMTELFKNEKLKGRKPRKPLGFTLIDDTQESVDTAHQDDVQAATDSPSETQQQEEVHTSTNFS